MRNFFYTCLLTLAFITNSSASNLEEAEATVALHKAFGEFDAHTGKDIFGPYFSNPQRPLGSTLVVLLNALNYKQVANDRAYLRTEKVPEVPGPEPIRNILFLFTNGTEAQAPYKDIETDTYEVQRTLDKYGVDHLTLFPVLRDIVRDLFLEMALEKYKVNANAESPYRHFRGHAFFWNSLRLTAAELVKTKLENEFKRKSEALRYWVREGNKKTKELGRASPIRSVSLTQDRYIVEGYKDQLERYGIHVAISTILLALELSPKKCEQHIAEFNDFAAYIEEHSCKEHEDCSSIGKKLYQKLAVVNAQHKEREAANARFWQRLEEYDHLPYVSDDEEEKNDRSKAPRSDREELQRSGIYLVPLEQANFYKKQVEELTQEVEELKAKLTQAEYYEQLDQAEYQEAEQQMAREREEMGREKKRLQTRIAKLSRKLSDFKSENEDLSARVADLTQKLFHLQDEYNDLATKEMVIKFQKGLITKVKAENAELASQVKELKQIMHNVCTDPATHLAGALRFEAPNASKVDIRWQEIISMVAELAQEGYSTVDAVRQLLNK